MNITPLRSCGTLLACLIAASPLRAAFDSADAPPKGDVHAVRVTPEGQDVPEGRQPHASGVHEAYAQIAGAAGEPARTTARVLFYER